MAGVGALVDLNQQKRIQSVEAGLEEVLQVIAEQGYYTNQQREAVVQSVDWLEFAGKPETKVVVIKFMNDVYEQSDGKQQTSDSIRHSAPKLHNL